MIASAKRGLAQYRNILYPIWKRHVNENGTIPSGKDADQILEETLFDAYRVIGNNEKDEDVEMNEDEAFAALEQQLDEERLLCETEDIEGNARPRGMPEVWFPIGSLLNG